MIYGADGKKLSKRHGATSVEAFRDEGYLPEALLNYLALLGWSLDGETTIVSAETLKTQFSLERVSKNPAIFDFEKLEWMNGAYLREMTPDTFAARMFPWLEQAGVAPAGDLQTRPDWYRELAPVVAERTKLLPEVVPLVRFLFADALAIEPQAAEKALAGPEAGPDPGGRRRDPRLRRPLERRRYRGGAPHCPGEARDQAQDRLSGRARGRHRVAGVAAPVRVNCAAGTRAHVGAAGGGAGHPPIGIRTPYL